MKTDNMILFYKQEILLILPLTEQTSKDYLS